MNGERIKLARKKAGLSLRGLAAKLRDRVSAQAIGKYERGEMSPSSDVLLALSKALGVSVTYLLAPQGVSLENVEFRRKASASARDIARVEADVIEWVERSLQIDQILFDSADTWNMPCGFPKSVGNGSEAEAAADKLREVWELGIDPLPNMTELLEEKGIKVFVTELPEKVSGLTCDVKHPSSGNLIPIIVVNSGMSLERRRFTLGHELGHLILKECGSANIEKLCDRFAGAFLAPRQHLLNEIGENRSRFGAREILGLKRVYRISAAAFLMRLVQVGAMEESMASYAYRTFAKPWRLKEPEPLENVARRERFEIPKRFERLVYRAVSEDLISVSKAVELLRVPLSEVETGIKGAVELHAAHRQ